MCLPFELSFFGHIVGTERHDSIDLIFAYFALWQLSFAE